MSLITPGGGSAGGAALALARVELNSGDVTTASTTFVDLTGATATITTGNNPVLVTFCGTQSNTSTSYNYFDVAVDGTRQGTANGIYGYRAPTTLDGALNLSFITAALTASSHTIKIQWRVTANTGTVYADGTNFCAWYCVKEIR